MSNAAITTAEQLLRLSEPGYRHELVRGELRRMSAASPLHGAVGMRLARRLADLVEEHDLGAVFGAETGFVLARDPDTVLAPDVAFVRADRLPAEAVPGFFPGPPDLAVEVLSPSDTAAAAGRKARSWIAHGTRLVWVVDPVARTVAVHRPRAEGRVLGVDDTLTGGHVVRGFRVTVRDLFPRGFLQP